MTTIGKFEVVDTLGRGAMGVVYKGRDASLNRHVAIKIMTAHLEMDPELRTRFYREAQAAGSLQHPNIITVYELGESEGHPFIAMEFVPGRDLDDIIAEREPLTIVEKVDLIEQVCRGLSYAHERHIVHRDIKPANLRVTQMGQVKIMDFGVAHLITSDLTATGSLMGTPYYMAPEVINGESVDARADIFSLGATFYELLSYSRPFQAESLQSVFRKILQSEPPSLRDLGLDTPPVIQKVIDRSLAKRPEDRYADTGEFLNDLMTFWETLPAPAQARAAATTALGHAAVRAASAARRRARVRRLVPLVAGGAALIAGGVIVASAVVSTGSFIPFRSSSATEPTAQMAEEEQVSGPSQPTQRDPEPEVATPSLPPPVAPAAESSRQSAAPAVSEPPPQREPSEAQRRLQAARSNYESSRGVALEARGAAVAAGAEQLASAGFARGETLVTQAASSARVGRYDEAIQAASGAADAYDSAATSAAIWRQRLDSASAAVAALRSEADASRPEYQQGESASRLALEAERDGEPGVALSHLASASQAYQLAARPAPAEALPSPAPGNEPPPPTTAQVVDATLGELRHAIETESIEALERVWIGLTAEQARNFQAAFGAMRDLRVTFDVRSVQATGGVIDVSVETTYEYVNEGNGHHEKQTFPQRFQLAERGDRWVIVGSHG